MAGRHTAGKYSNLTVQHRPHATVKDPRPAPTTDIDVRATSTPRRSGKWYTPVPRCPPGNGLSLSSSRCSETNRKRGGPVGGFLYRGQVGPGRAGCGQRAQPVGGVVGNILYRGQVGPGRAGCRERGQPVGGFFSRCTGVVHPTPL